MKKALIIGASSGIGRELTLTLSKQGYELGLMARRVELLESLQKEIPTKTHIAYLDVSLALDAIEKVQAMVTQMKGIDLIIVNAGVGFSNPKLDWLDEKKVLDVNVYGFCALAGFAFKYFSKQGHGHLVGISSVIALRGTNIAPAYSASKAFVSNYLEGLRKKAFADGIPIVVTDVKPGFVDTEMISKEGKFWIAPPSKVAKQIYSAIKAKKKHVYVTKRWRLIGWLLKLIPDWLYFKT